MRENFVYLGVTTVLTTGAEAFSFDRKTVIGCLGSLNKNLLAADLFFLWDVNFRRIGNALRRSFGGFSWYLTTLGIMLTFNDLLL